MLLLRKVVQVAKNIYQMKKRFGWMYVRSLLGGPVKASDGTIIGERIHT